MQQDFYQRINFYQTISYELNDELSRCFLVELELFKSYHQASMLVMSEHDLAMSFLVSVLGNYEGYTHLRQRIEQLDFDLIEVAMAYIENNLNLSMAAKTIYMHRNTFMTKLERFILLTELNIKEFKFALLAYLMIKSVRSKNM